MTSPIYAGASIETNHGDGTGTLGGFGQDASGNPVLITCSHVIFPGFQAAPTVRVYSPNYSSTCCGGPPIARPAYDANQPARQINDDTWVGGYRDGLWTGGFGAILSRVNVNGHNVPGYASPIDCAVARLDPGIRYQNAWHIERDGVVTTIPIKGAVSGGLGAVRGPAFGTAPTPDQYVRVYSATHGTLQYGTMLSLPPDFEHFDDPDHLLYRWGIGDGGDEGMGARPNVDQFFVLPRPTPRDGMSYADTYRQGESLNFHGGESGSFVINSDNLVIGMIVRAMDLRDVSTVDYTVMEMRGVGQMGMATPIEAILNHLDVTIPAAEDGWSGTVPAAGPTVLAAGEPDLSGRRRVVVQRLREELTASVRGRLLLGLIGRHFREVRRLLTTVRPVAVTWQRMAGPAYYHHALRSLEIPGHLIPTNINGVSRDRLVSALLPLVEEYASDLLRRDLRRYGELLTSVLLDIPSIMDAPRALARQGVRV